MQLTSNLCPWTSPADRRKADHAVEVSKQHDARIGRPNRVDHAEHAAASARLGARNLQRDLSKLHFYSGPITGVYTPATRAAVIRFQKAAHLVPDGLWGPKSQAALDKMLGRKPSSGKLPPPLGWVRNLQRDLSKLHFYSGPITGVYTPATKAAVILFQKAAHLVPDGLWGPKSQAALDKMLHRRK